MNKNLYRGSLSTIVLKLLRDGGRMYGYEIVQKARELSDGELEITEGALYPTLHKLEAEGHLSVEFGAYNGRKRKYYSLTPAGEKQTKQQLDELRDYLRQMELLLGIQYSKIT